MNSRTILVLWCLHPILESVAAIALWRSNLHKKFPVFFAYLLAHIALFGVMFPLRTHYTAYFWVYWLGSALCALLGFKVIHEIFLDVFRPYHTLKDLGTVIFKWAFVVMLLVSMVVAFSNSSDRDPLEQAVVTLQSSVRLIQFGPILFLLLFSRFLGVSRRQISFGIALGFGFFAGMELLLLALDSGRLLPKGSFEAANMVAFNLSLVIWITYCMRRSSIRQTATIPLQTHRWEQGLSDIQHPVPSDSLIPMFESMVERAISRSSNLDEELPGSQEPATARKKFAAVSSGRRGGI